MAGNALNPDGSTPVSEQPITRAVPMTVGEAAVAAGRKVGVACTAVGNATFEMAGGGSLTVPLELGWQQFDFAVIGVGAATATATYQNLY